MSTKPVTIHTLQKKKELQEKITMLTAYDATFAHLLDDAGIDILLIGDSLGMVIQGKKTTLPVTLDEMIYHTRAVARGSQRSHLVGDLPFMSYQTNTDDGMRAAGRLMKEGGCHSVKLEGGARNLELTRRLVAAGIPVMGHIGLTPQSYHQMGGFKVQGKKKSVQDELLRDAIALQEAGAFSLVLEGMPTSIAQTITESISIPTIGIGAGPHCDGQVLVIYDLLGMDDRFRPKFVRQYDNFAERIRSATQRYIDDVKSSAFPSEKESFHVPTDSSDGIGKLYSSAGDK